MTSTLWIASIVLSPHFAHAYILLTANLEDVHAIAKQVVESPVTGQLNKIVRRAANAFNQQVARSRFQKRADDDADSDGVGGRLDGEDQGLASDDGRIQRRRGDTELEALGKNAGFYLKTIMNMFRRRGDNGLVALGKNAGVYLKSIMNMFENFKIE